MQVVIKDWGVQVWQDCEVIMVMRAGTRTSIHLHRHHDTHLECIYGEFFVNKFSTDVRCEDSAQLTLNDNLHLPAGLLHEIQATTDCVIHERYSAVGCGTSIDPIDDIERMSHTEYCQAHGLWDDNSDQTPPYTVTDYIAEFK